MAKEINFKPSGVVNFGKYENVATIDIDGVIGWDDDKKTIKDILKQITDIKEKNIIVNIDSPGGFVDDMLSIHDMLAQHEAHIETRVFGMTASAATVIAMAGDVRKMSENALFLIHKASTITMGTAIQIGEDVEDLKKIDERIENIYAKRTGKDIGFIRELMSVNSGQGKWLNASDCMEFGLIDEVIEAKKMVALSKEACNYLNINYKSIDMNEETQKEVKTLSEKFTAFRDKVSEVLEKLTAKKEPDEEKEPEENKELETLKAENEALKAENEATKKEVEKLKASYDEIEVKFDTLTKEIGSNYTPPAPVNDLNKKTAEKTAVQAAIERRTKKTK